MQAISTVLAEVPDWRGLANWLNIPTDGIHENCAREVDLAMCYREKLVRRYCDKQSSGNPYKVAEDISVALEKMEKNRQGKKLRNLVFDTCKWVAKDTEPSVAA